jgi:hypothetical protein
MPPAVPSLSLQKFAICRQMTAMDSDSRPLGAGMGVSAFFHGRDKYCHNGAMAFARHHGGRLPGSKTEDHGPFPRSPEAAVLQGKS